MGVAPHALIVFVGADLAAVAIGASIHLPGQKLVVTHAAVEPRGVMGSVISLDKAVKIVGRVPAEVLAARKFLQVAVAKYFFVEGLWA